jgi:hypothetical protein
MSQFDDQFPLQTARRPDFRLIRNKEHYESYLRETGFSAPPVHYPESYPCFVDYSIDDDLMDYRFTFLEIPYLKKMNEAVIGITYSPMKFDGSDKNKQSLLK